MRFLVRFGFAQAATIVVTVLVYTTTSSTAAPSQIQGKSVIVGWTETRNQTFEGDAQARNISVSVDARIYVSTAGRAFAKVFARGVRQSSELEQGPGDRATLGIVHFEGNSLLVDKQMQSGARRIIVTFDSGYTSCEARIIYGKENGARPIRRYGNISGRYFVVHSMQVSGISCSVRNGNVFGR